MMTNSFTLGLLNVFFVAEVLAKNIMTSEIGRLLETGLLRVGLFDDVEDGDEDDTEFCVRAKPFDMGITMIEYRMPLLMLVPILRVVSIFSCSLIFW